MSVELQKLDLSRKTELIELFLDCFRDDSYYRRQFPHNTISAMRRAFTPILEYHLANSYVLGAFHEDRMIGFLIGFDYHRLKTENHPMFLRTFTGDSRSSLPYEAQLHRRVEALDGPVMYLLSIGVRRQLRRQGVARTMMERMLEDWVEYSFASDVSSEGSLALCRHLGFESLSIERHYWYVQRRDSRELPEFGERIPVAVPSLGLLRDVFGAQAEQLETASLELTGYQTVIGLHTDYFKHMKEESCTAIVVQLTYQQLLEYQRYINMTHQTESWVETDRWGIVLVYHLTFEYDGPLLWNDTLRELVQTRQSEWDTISDLYALFPVEYTRPEAITGETVAFDPQIKMLLHSLDFRTHYEAGVPGTGDAVDEMSDLKKRICRRHLGKLKIKVTEETVSDNYLTGGATEGQPAWVDLILSVDEGTRCGVLCLASLSLPFLMSHYMDNIIRNQLMVQDEYGAWVNFYQYVHRKFGLLKRGTPKLFCVIPREKDCLSEGQIASLLMGETIYATEEGLGVFCDEEVLQPIRSEHGMGQYDRGFVCASTNVLLQFGEGSGGLVSQRLDEEAITYFYIELILFEEAAIQIADAQIVDFLTNRRKSTTAAFLKRAYRIHEEYSDTIAFWDVQVNYPSSRKSLAMLRRAFQIEEKQNYLKRDLEQLQTMFDTKSAIMDRADSTTLNYIMLLLALMQGVAIVNPDLFQHASGLPVGGGAVLAVLVIYRIIIWLMARTPRR